MARVTVEDCLDHVDNRFELVLVASKRARQLARQGIEPTVEWDNDKPTVVALREIAIGHVTKDILKQRDQDYQTSSLDLALSANNLNLEDRCSMPGQQVSQSKQQLNVIIDAYLKPSDVERVLVACDYADIAHDGITRKSGEPYILHPIAVSCILAHMRMDAETLMAALLHDVIEDTDFTKEDITEKFGKTVAELVDGVTKLSHSSDKEYNKAASFRKILQATLQDPRVLYGQINVHVSHKKLLIFLFLWHGLS
ncbi:unnamed protein product, partial [Oppiella nova]